MTSLLGENIILTSTLGKKGDLMDREEILSRYKKENENNDEMTKDVLIKAGNFSSALGLLAVAIINFIKTFFYDGESDGLLGLFLLMIASHDLYVYAKLKDKKSLIKGTIAGIFSLVCLIMYFKGLK